MIEKEECLKIGYLSKPHGVKGELVLMLGEGIYADDFEVEYFLLDIDNGLVPFYVEMVRTKSNKALLVKLESVETEVYAKRLCDTDVYIKVEEMVEGNGNHDVSLVGYSMQDDSQGYIGKVVALREITKNPLFELEFEGKEIMVPMNGDFITSIDSENKTINVDLPEGLIDLYLSKEGAPDFD